MADHHVRRQGSDYAQAFLALLPTGPAWPRHAWSTLAQTVFGLADYWGFVDGRAADLLEIESDPRTTVELLPDWERNFGLPDPCYAEPLSVYDRQVALVQRMTILGGQSRQFFIDAAAQVGYTISITEYRPFMVGIDRCGDNRVIGDGTYLRDEFGHDRRSARTRGRQRRAIRISVRARAARQSILLDGARSKRAPKLVSMRQRSMRRRSSLAHRACD